jgi:glutathionylspermidine synthase
MERRDSRPRDGWRERVEKVGLVYPMTDREDGTQTPYWFENAVYALNMAEVEYLEAVTEELHSMCVEAANHVLKTPERLTQFGLDPAWAEYLRHSLPEPSLYGRFDLAYKDLMYGHAKLLEYNADTPTGLLEASVAQWYWLQELHPDKDQWNSLHERLVAAWKRHEPFLPDAIHFAHSDMEKSGEEWMTVAYLRDTCIEAGYQTYGLTVEEIGYDSDTNVFVGLQEEPIKACFKLYPWEDLLTEGFGKHVLASSGVTQWIEPAWKSLLSNKAILAVLWELFPKHPNLLPAYFDDPRGMPAYVAKPLHGREGAGIKVVTPWHREERASEHYGAEGYVFQEWHELPCFHGTNYTVVGSWVVDGKAAGVGIRESDSPITDYFARFVPSMIDGERPSKKQVEEWLSE